MRKKSREVMRWIRLDTRPGSEVIRRVCKAKTRSGNGATGISFPRKSLEALFIVPREAKEWASISADMWGGPLRLTHIEGKTTT